MIELNEKGNIEDARSRNKDIGDEVVTKAELRTILQHADIRQKALFLTLVSSGLMIAEALQLIPKDIDFNNDPVLVNVGRPFTMSGRRRITFLSTMSGRRRITFLSDEAAESVGEWLKIRKQYIKKVSRSVSDTSKVKETKAVDDNRVFPYSAHAARAMWQKMLRESGFADKTESGYRYKYNLRTFRKFFCVNLIHLSAMSYTTVAYLMGHNTRYLSTVDISWDAKTLGEWYKKAMPALTIFEPADLTTDFNDMPKLTTTEILEEVYKKIEPKLEEKDKEIASLRQEIIRLSTEKVERDKQKVEKRKDE